MIAKDQNIALLIVGNAATSNPEWKEYADYSFAREKGLRKEAFRHLEVFLQQTQKWTNEQKIEFMQFLFPFFETVIDADYGLFPNPLKEKLVKSTLEYWCSIEEKDERPFRWYGRYFNSDEHLFKAIEINPKDDLARQALLKRWSYWINYSLHHLPDYYIGDPAYDLETTESAKKQIAHLSTKKLQDEWLTGFEANLELIRNYIEWQTSEHPNLEQWGEENKRRVSYRLSQSHYYEE